MRCLLYSFVLLLLVGCNQRKANPGFGYGPDAIPHVRDRTTGAVRPVTFEEIQTDPCYWCARVLNADPDHPPYDCSSACPCENAYSGYGPNLYHTGQVHDNGTFALYNGESGAERDVAVSGTPKSNCIPLDKDGDAVVTLIYSMKYPCDSLAQYAEETTLTAALYSFTDTTVALVQDQQVVDTLDLVREPCCLADNQCILSRSFRLQFVPQLGSGGRTVNYLLKFFVDHEHSASSGHATVDWSTPHHSGTANRTSGSSSWDHLHEYRATVSFCTYRIPGQLEDLNPLPQN